MKIQDKVKMDSKLTSVLDFIEKAADELDEAKTDRQQRFLCAQLVEFETELLTISYKIYRFKEMAKEIYNNE